MWGYPVLYFFLNGCFFYGCLAIVLVNPEFVCRILGHFFSYVNPSITAESFWMLPWMFWKDSPKNTATSADFVAAKDP